MTLRRLQEPGYAAAEWGLSAAESCIRLHLLFFLTSHLGLSPGLAGLLISLGVFWDAITDPLVGWLSDQTRGPWGRRVPYLLAGLFSFPPLLVGLFARAWMQVTLDQRIVGFACLYLAFNTATTLLSVPHAALAGDLTQDERIRTRLFAWRYFFTTLGLLSGIAIPGYLLTTQGDVLEAYEQSAWILAAIAALSATVTIIACFRQDRRRRSERNPRQGSARAILRGLLRNKPFLILLLAFILATVGQAVNASLALYYYRLYLQLPEVEIQKILGLFTVVIVVSIIGWNLLSRRFSKTLLLASGVGSLGLLGSFSYPFFSPGDLLGPYLMAVIGGLLVGSVFLLEVMVADSVDYGAVQTERSDYGSYFGLWRFGSKLSRALAIGLAGGLLEAIGFEATAQPSESTLRALSLLFGPGVGVFFVAGALLVLLYPLNQKRVGQIHRILRKRARAKSEPGHLPDRS